jgi:hypothetical protein
MIVKVVAKQSTGGGGSFGGLADYMLDEKNEREKVEDYEFTNCSFEQEQVKENIGEITNTQEQNTRSKSDKTMHLIVSFHEGENPTLEERKIIERELVKSIGLDTHQRLSVYHTNTDANHIHIAINQVDNEFFKNTIPFQSFNKLHVRAIELENELGLKPTNHIPRTAEKEKSAQEVHRGIDNFKEWAKGEAGDKIKELLNDPKRTNWEELHKTLGDFNLELRERGNGLVVCDSEGKLFCKASDVSRELSKNNLEKKIGKFEKPIEKFKGDKSFGETKGDKSKLWDNYREAEKQKAINKQRLLGELKTTYTKDKEALNERGRLERGEIKRSTQVFHGGKKPKYQELFEIQKKRAEVLRANFEKAKDAIYNDTRVQGYKDYLVGEALKGDVKALESLRASAEKKEKEGENTLFGEEKKIKINERLNPKVTKDGEVVYEFSSDGKIIDRGKNLDIKNISKEVDYFQVLVMAREKYGKVLNISGDDDFKKQMVSVAIKNKLDIVFEDKTMEAVRRGALNQDKEQAVREKNNEYRGVIRKKEEKRDIKTRIKQKIKEKINGRENDRTKNLDRWRGYIDNVRNGIRKSVSTIENAISNFRDIRSSGGDTIHERLADVQHTKDRGIGEKGGIDRSGITRTATDRERNEALRRNDVKGEQIVRGRDGRGGGIER